MPIEDEVPQVGDTVTDRTDRDFMRGQTDPQPRLRANLTAALTLTTTWQRLNFAGASAYNTNTFPMINGNPLVYWDTVARVYRFQSPVDRNYDTTLNGKFQASNLLSALNLTTVSVQMRYVVPAPTPIYFPLPDGQGYVDLLNVNLLSATSGTFGLIAYASQPIRTYGLGVELRLSGALLGTATLQAADFIIYGR